jgi:hypothetical protein
MSIRTRYLLSSSAPLIWASIFKQASEIVFDEYTTGLPILFQQPPVRLVALPLNSSVVQSGTSAAIRQT